MIVLQRFGRANPSLSQCSGGHQQGCNLSALQQRSSSSKKFLVVMLRHGESEWNQKNLFCGWYDAPLTEKGAKEATLAGKAIKDAKINFDIAHTSLLSRAQDTLKHILKEIGQECIPVHKTWRLNERHYGNLTGLNKAETAKKYGEKQVKIWRRSYDTPPPPIKKDNKYYECITKDPRYCEGPPPEEFPKSESLKMTIKRTLPYWDNVIVPQIRDGKKLIITAHGNSLRGIIKHLDKISDEAIMQLNLPTAVPFFYELDECMVPLAPMKFLGDPETVKKAMESVANQGKAK
ncbi:phosphoglycerate mutase 2 [Drosophila hydei]|uniref:Phosphoglycerate mutase n=1 Tax=Drosophila hydei TaxID=7224 RepID=A0A6J1MG98_DROHY|nr:phosphoglycerate mutase 2 [Drosophila hydei]